MSAKQGGTNAVMMTSGRVVTGLGRAGIATSLDWFRTVLQRDYDIVPVAGTLNVAVGGDPLAMEHHLLTAGTILVPPSPDYSCSILLRAAIGQGDRKVSGILLRPLVPRYDAAQFEFVAPVHLRTELGLKDGDEVSIELGDGEPDRPWVSPAVGAADSMRPMEGVLTGQAGFSVDLSIGALPLWITWSITAQGVVLSLFGGIPHVGATALAVPRASLVDPARRSATSSVLTVVGHKDDLLARKIAEVLSADLNRVATVTVGVHAGPKGSYNMPKEDAQRILDLVGRVGEIVVMAARAGGPAGDSH